MAPAASSLGGDQLSGRGEKLAVFSKQAHLCICPLSPQKRLFRWGLSERSPLRVSFTQISYFRQHEHQFTANPCYSAETVVFWKYT